MKSWNFFFLKPNLGTKIPLLYSCAIERCGYLSELYLGTAINLEIYSFRELLMPEEYPHDPVVAVILDVDKLHPVKVERL